MIKAAGRAGDLPLLIIGLSAPNLAKLRAGEPIAFDTAPLGLPPMTVWVLGGETEEEIAAELGAAGMPIPGIYHAPT